MIFHFKHHNFIVVIYNFRLNMDADFTIVSFIAYLKDLCSEGSGSTFQLSKACTFSALKVQLDTNPPSQSTLDQCLLIGLSNLPSQSQHIAFVVAALRVLLQFDAKWDSSTLSDNQRTPYHIICQCPSDPYELLDRMIKSSGGKLINQQDSSGCTAVMYAVHNKNVECLRCLITHGADLNLGSDSGYNNMTTPLIDTIRAHSSSPSPITRDILNLLLENGVDVNKPSHAGRSPIKYAIDSNSIYCVRKLVLHKLKTKSMWLQAVSNTSIDILGCLLDLGVSKDFTDLYGEEFLHCAVCTGDITVIRFLLEAGLPILKKIYRECRGVPCYMRRSSVPEYMINVTPNSIWYDPCLQAISMKRLDVVQLLDNYKQQTFQSIETLKCAVSETSLEIVNYLLSNYEYPLNMEYIKERAGVYYYHEGYHTILTEACQSRQLEMVTLLVEHGADPSPKRVHKKYPNALMIAINRKNNELVSHFIRSGADLDGRLHDAYHGDVLPFEYAVIKNNKQAAEMLLHAGCSCGKFSLVNNISTGIRCFRQTFQGYFSPELQKLMIEWDVLKNNVMPLQQLCRKSILKHLCPRAVKKISGLPLPPRIIRYLSIPELDDVQV